MQMELMNLNANTYSKTSALTSLDTLVRDNPCRTLLRDNLVRHSRGTLLRNTLVGPIRSMSSEEGLGCPGPSPQVEAAQVAPSVHRCPQG